VYIHSQLFKAAMSQEYYVSTLEHVSPTIFITTFDVYSFSAVF